MEEESREPVEGEEEFEDEEAAEKRRHRRKLIAALVAVIVIGSVGGWFGISALLNNAPTAEFSVRSADLRAYVDARNSTDPNGDAISFRWDWGDQTSPGSGITTSHLYADEGNFTIILTATDSRGASAGTSRPIVIQVFPTALFIARTDSMDVSVDATSSFVAKGTITSYAWDFGDASTATGVTASHRYGTSGKYLVKLTVTDDQQRTMTTSRLVSPAATTVDLLMDQFFQANCPYNNYWFLRYQSYGDQVLDNEIPCTSYYPWVLFSASTKLQPINPSWIYTIYKYDARVRNHPAYSLTDPVILPVFNSSVATSPDSYVNLDLKFRYLNTSLINNLRQTSFAVNPKYSDGFGYLVQGNITMDLLASKRIFGVKGSSAAEAQRWWWNYTGEGTGKSPRFPGPVETKLALWLENNGNLKYDIFNGFEWFYETDLTYLNATVSSDGTTTVKVFWDGWGYDVLLARWFYWGSADYRQAVNSSFGAVQPLGWSPMELCWCEDATIKANITTSLDLDMVTVPGYAFYAGADWGRDQIPATKDDKPLWVFEPAYMDYVPRLDSGSPGEGGYGNSELHWWEGSLRTHVTPGSYAYGEPYEYMVSAARWRLAAGTTIQFVLPRNATREPLEVPWYDPVQSTWDPVAKIGRYSTFMSAMTLKRVVPASDPGDPYYVWDARGMVLSFAGPYSWASTGRPSVGEPLIEFTPLAGA